MRCGLTRPGSGALARAWVQWLASLIVASTALTASGDILHLKGGGSVEGQIIAEDGQSYKVRTVVGTITVPVGAVERLERKPSILGEYEQRRTAAPETAAAQVALAEWCQEQDLTGPWRKHMKRAIELDPNCEPARTALGYVRVGGTWVDGRTLSQTAESEEGESKADDRQVEDRDDAKVVAAIQTRWTVQIRAIKKNMLDSSVKRLNQKGRAKIVAIADPLAILPLARLLSTGSWVCRDALVEALSHFPQDEATMNLAVLALVDRDEGIRRRALVELKRRNDPRVIPQFRRALGSDSDPLIRRAAIGLGMLAAVSAVPELIDVLTAQRRKWIEVPIRRYFGEYPSTFNSPTVISLGGVSQIRHTPMIGIESIGGAFVVVDSEHQLRDVTVFRTEVLEALKSITGKNFGFDAAAWRRWYQEQQP